MCKHDLSLPCCTFSFFSKLTASWKRLYTMSSIFQATHFAMTLVCPHESKRCSFQDQARQGSKHNQWIGTFLLLSDVHQSSRIMHLWTNSCLPSSNLHNLYIQVMKWVSLKSFFKQQIHQIPAFVLLQKGQIAYLQRFNGSSRLRNTMWMGIWLSGFKIWLNVLFASTNCT